MIIFSTAGILMFAGLPYLTFVLELTDMVVWQRYGFIALACLVTSILFCLAAAASVDRKA